MTYTTGHSQASHFHDFSPAGIAQIDKDGFFIEVNTTFCEVFGYEPDELLGQHLKILLPSHLHDHHEHLFRSVRRDNAGRKLNGAAPLGCLHKNGQTLYVLIGLRPVYGSDSVNHQPAWLVHVCDVTELEESKRELQAALKNTLAKKVQLRELLSEKEQMLRFIAHELRTPLSVAKSFAEYDVQDETWPFMNKKIMGTLIDRLSVLSELSACWLGHNEDCQTTMASVQDRTQQVVNSLIQTIQGEGSPPFQLQFDQGADQPVYIAWSRFDSILRRILNLSMNSRSYCTGPTCICVGLTQQPGQPANLYLKAHMNLNSAQALQVAQAPNYVSADLELIRKQANKLGATLQTEEMGGLVNSLQLDLQVKEQGLKTTFEPIAPLWQGLRVLLVDDDPMIRKLYAVQLQKWGATVDLAYDGQNAIDFLSGSDHFYDVILMDLYMPVKDGFDCTREIKRLFAHRFKRIVALTAGATVEDRQKALLAGVSHFFVKPLKQEYLREIALENTAYQPL